MIVFCALDSWGSNARGKTPMTDLFFRVLLASDPGIWADHNVERRIGRPCTSHNLLAESHPPYAVDPLAAPVPNA
ncbi:hypothetical protein CH63R_12795 [Colletotrichum higginsianum IMI 349063]|uniref:Uncharacterized protein n=1 Tax=Colletotrichum higginsianum (strain IMI 349063) TaxID=759273 RepID=A0A1B7XV99_COLHI|nr:hypothetical protein CH63R_12795 [Colletotrichum higginsianum IMI 349063]OBR03668.1 hypothetical protein CH63R_12795 [Colletotrichum higginsianum IMI 349063]